VHTLSQNEAGGVSARADKGNGPTSIGEPGPPAAPAEAARSGSGREIRLVEKEHCGPDGSVVLHVQRHPGCPLQARYRCIAVQFTSTLLRSFVLTARCYVVSRSAFANIQPVLFLALRDSIAVPLILLFAGSIDFRESRFLPRMPQVAECPAFIILGATLWLFNISNLIGLQLTSSILASTFQQTVPTISLLTAVVFGQEGFPSALPSSFAS